MGATATSSTGRWGRSTTRGPASSSGTRRRCSARCKVNRTSEHKVRATLEKSFDEIGRGARIGPARERLFETVAPVANAVSCRTSWSSPSSRPRSPWPASRCGSWSTPAARQGVQVGNVFTVDPPGGPHPVRPGSRSERQPGQERSRWRRSAVHGGGRPRGRHHLPAPPVVPRGGGRGPGRAARRWRPNRQHHSVKPGAGRGSRTGRSLDPVRGGRLCLAAASGRSLHFYIGGPGLAGSGPAMDTRPLPSAERDAPPRPLGRPWHRQRGPRRRAPVGRRTVGGPPGHPDRRLGGRASGERPRPGADRAAGSLRAVAEEVRERASRGRMEVLPPGRPGLSRSAWPRCATRPRPLLCGAASAARAGGWRWWAARHPEQGFLPAPGRSRGGGGRLGRAWCRARRRAWTGPATSGRWTWAARRGPSWARRWTRWTRRRRASCRSSSTGAGRCTASCLRESGRASRRFPGETDSSPVHRMRSWCSGPAGTAVRCTPWRPPVSQGRPVLACPGETWARGGPGLQPAGGATGSPGSASSRIDALRAVGLAADAAAAGALEPGSMPGLSAAAAQLYALLDRQPRHVREVLDGPRRAGPGRSCERAGASWSSWAWWSQRPGERYQKV